MSDIVVVALIGAIQTLIVTFGIFFLTNRVGKVHELVNSKMGELLVETGKAARAEGVQQERTESRDREEKKT